jgi:PAS domain S-box-containing protein
MFRPGRERSLLGYVPLPLVASVFLVFAALLLAAVVVGMQFERHLLVASGVVPPGPHRLLPAGLPLTALWKVLGTLLALGAVALLAFATWHNYRSVTQTFERVKTLMRNILQSIPTGVLTLDAEGRITTLNAAAERHLALRSPTVGRTFAEVLPEAPELVAWIRAALHGDRLPEDADIALTTGDDRRVTLRLSASALRDETGRPDGVVVLIRDVTEMNRLELQLRRADKLAALGTLAAGVAHEVKNPLHALTLNLHLLAKELAAPQPSAREIQGYLEILRSELDRLHRIVETFLRFSRPSLPEMKPLDLNALAERALSLVAFEAADHRVTIETAFDPRLDAVPGDEGQLAQVVLNLLINALQAMPSGGVLTVTTRRVDDWAELAVADTGEGIPHESLPHVFDPYFTTRPGGVGLGLPIAHRIVEGHQGTIDVESQAGKGTRLVVRLPLAGGGATAGGPV